MSKAERYIELVSDENGHLCDQHALRAVEIAREEMIEKSLRFLKDRLYKSGYVGIINLCDEYINAMKDE